MSEDKLIQIQELVDRATDSLKTANMMLREMTGIVDTDRERHMSRAPSTGLSSSAEGRIVEGIFDGQNMVDADGETYPVPANYASKSKLVEGDGMKLTITDEGKFIYKQIAPIDRKTVIGVLIQEDGQYKVLAEGKAYRVLLASVTFYRAEVGDQVTILIPNTDTATWGAVDAVIPKQIAEKEAASKLGQGSQMSDDGELSPTVS